MKFFLKHKMKTALVLFAYLISYLASTVLSTLLIFGGLGSYTTVGFTSVLICSILIILSIFVLHLHSASFRHASFLELFKAIMIVVFTAAINLVLLIFNEHMSFAWVVATTLFFFVAAAFATCYVRLYDMLMTVYRRHATRGMKRVLIVGAGDAGTTVLKELQTTDKINYLPVGIVDDNPDLHGSYLCGVRVLGGTEDIRRIADKTRAQMIIVAIPTAKPSDIKRITEHCLGTKCEIKVMPGLYQLMNGKVSVSQLRDVDVTDLLGRDPVEVNLDEVMNYISGKRVIITGGGGSIGSELCRQIATKNPAHLIILDIYENGAYDIEQELIRLHPDLKITTLIASIRDKKKLDTVFETYKPEIVFHAAAHKHVPLMETSPCEAVKNNVCGTYNLVSCADKHGVSRFVQISTDKAVNPTNIMGATKRICEMIIQAYAKRSQTSFVAVRFGNVLGSNGSVIPLFKKQIMAGGPVTVTHKDIIRYFMTIPEAVSLVLQAGAYAKGGEIYVLDMGEQVRIYDLAERLIMLTGFEPHIDIEIKITGLRPGEKLYEERLMAEEGLSKTPNGLISIARPIPMDEDALWDKLAELDEAAHGESERMKELVRELVPTYKIDSGS